MSRFAALPPMKVAGARAPAGSPGGSLASLIRPVDTPLGPLHLKTLAVGPWRAVLPATVQALALSEQGLDPARPLFLDTETTGLSGGTGTLPFLVGVAAVVDGQVVVEQAHLPGPGQERPVLEWLRARLSVSSLLVTFNGKSFDWPLLRARYVMNRLRPPPELPHLDLLHIARRVFRYELEQATLGALERAALGVRRVGDLGGPLIPAVWFDYLRTGRVAMLARVLAHNERDVRSMVELLHHLCDGWEGRGELPLARRLGLAVVAARCAGGDERALALVEGVDAVRGPLAGVALELKAGVLRRRGETRAAAEALERALPMSPAAARVRLKLAKLYEHQLKDVDAARRHAPHAREAEPAPSHQRRLQRLRR